MKYKVCLSTKVKSANLPKVEKGTYILVIESEDYTAKEIKAIKAKGYILLAYLSIGTISTERLFYKYYKQYKKKQLKDWKKEYYMDMTAKKWLDFLVSRAKTLRAKGFDGYWLDNLDVYEEYKSDKTFTACYNLMKRIKAIGGYVMVNGGSEFWDDAVDKNKNLTKIVNGVTQEEVFSLIKNYAGKGTFGTQSASQSKFYQSLLKKLLKKKVQTYLLEYTRNDSVKAKIHGFCTKYKMTGYYISSDVNL